MNLRTNPVPLDHVDFEPDQPTCFLLWGGEGMYQVPVGPLIRTRDAIRFDYYDMETQSMSPLTMALDADGLYQWRGKPGAHRWGVLGETKTHLTLTGNYTNADGTQGVEIIIWPVKNVRVRPSVATKEFLSSQHPVWQLPRHPIRGPLPDKPILGEPVIGEGFEMHHLAPSEPGQLYEQPKRIKLDDLKLVFGRQAPPLEDKMCSCGQPGAVVVAVMTMEGDFVSTEALCSNCFSARQTTGPDVSSEGMSGDSRHEKP